MSGIGSSAAAGLALFGVAGAEPPAHAAAPVWGLSPEQVQQVFPVSTAVDLQVI